MAHGGDTRMTPQEVMNESYDWLLNLIGTSLWGYDDTEGAEGARRVSVDSSGRLETNSNSILPTDGTNPSLTISNSDTTVVSTTVLTKRISGVNYTKTISKNAAGDVVSISAWS